MSLPTGTVTFLFTDIEGSTRLLQELGEGYRRVLDDHTALMRKAVADRLGVAVALDATAVIAGRRGRHDVSLRLAGAADLIRETAHGQAPLPLYNFEDPRDLASGTLSRQQIAATWERGRDMSLEDAITLAKEELSAEDDG